MMKHIYYIMFALAMGFACVSCDEHEPIDLDIHPGYILCSDGQIVSPSVFNRDVHTPVAVVFAEKTDQHQALAVLLDEIAPVAFADTLSFDQKTSGSETEYDGYVNTVALQTTHLDRDSLVVKDNKADPRNYYTSPLGHPIIERCGGTPVNRSPENAGCWYWTSTEVAQNKMNQAWLFSMADGSRHKAPKTNCYRARLIVEYNPL